MIASMSCTGTSLEEKKRGLQIPEVLLLTESLTNPKTSATLP
jgi:hypothetical protein